ncbi:hypothetical protein MTY59_15440 [Mycobacterium senriense]|uniref:Transmembrane protein n=3 Tax=Mycobacterium senriense TaxID=2775496 RepID=A0ABM7SNW1_9MYCO|nr:hypothetical protein MTY59_15440 [Mycobacterium senriense]
MSARQRLRRATRESLATPAFSSPIDCTPWVTGGLWPAELSTVTPETATLAEYLKADLERIARAANDELKLIKRSGMTDPSRQAAEARVIDAARGRAVRRVESTIRYLHAVQSGARPPAAPPPRVEPSDTDLQKTQVLPAIREVKPVAEARPPSPPESVPRPGRRRRRESAEEAVTDTATPQAAGPKARADDAARRSADASDLDETQVIPVIREEPVSPMPADPAPPELTDSGRHHAIVDPGDEDEPQAAAPEHEPPGAVDAPHLEETQVIPVVTRTEPVFEAPAQRAPEPAPDQADSGRHHAVVDEPAVAKAEPVPQEPAAADVALAAADVAPAVEADTAAFAAAGPQIEKPTPPTRSDGERLNRLLEFVVRQEPRVNWAIGERADGTTVLVTDLAHGWIPSGITLPAGVRLLEPERRTGRVAALIGETARVVTYAPGDSLRRSVDFAATRSSVEPRTLPAIDDLANVLSAATRGRAELPKIVPRLAEAAAAGTVIVDQEVDVLRVHLDTARYQLLVQYPNVNPALLLKCLLMAATEGIASGDAVSANYHLAWYQKLGG